jgi:hypothetical protein
MVMGRSAKTGFNWSLIDSIINPSYAKLGLFSERGIKWFKESQTQVQVRPIFSKVLHLSAVLHFIALTALTVFASLHPKT